MVWLLIGVCADMNQHFIPGIEAPPISSTAFPLAAVSRILFRLDMEVIDVIHQVLQRIKQQVALHPTAGQLSIHGGFRRNRLLSSLTDEHGRGKAVASWWTSNWEIKWIALW